MKKTPVWIKEDEAANMIGYTPEVFRRKVKAGKLDVAYSNLNPRKLLYNKTDIEKAIEKHSTLIA